MFFFIYQVPTKVLRWGVRGAVEECVYHEMVHIDRVPFQGDLVHEVCALALYVETLVGPNVVHVKALDYPWMVLHIPQGVQVVGAWLVHLAEALVLLEGDPWDNQVALASEMVALVQTK